jgi:ABC-type branched-subunit amino acid transport system substrate-binding protein
VPSNSFVAKIQAAYGHAPLRWTTEAVDGLTLLSNALNSIPDNNVSSIALQNALSKVKEYSGESGTAIFDTNGNAHRQMFIKEIKNGKFILHNN